MLKLLNERRRPSASRGIVLLSVYSVGLGLPFVSAAGLTVRLFGWFQTLGRLGRSLQIRAGATVVGILTGQLTALSYWLLETSPAFAKIG